MFLLGKNDSGAWTIDSNARIEYLQLRVSAPSMEEKVKRVRSIVGGHGAIGPDTPEIREFSTELLQPILRRAGLKKNLVLVNDGALGTLPFEAIPAGKQLLGDQFRISYAASLGMLARLRGPARDYRNSVRIPMIAFGGAYYNRKSSAHPLDTTTQEARQIALSNFLRGGYRERGWNDLPGARAETVSIGEIYYQTSSDRAGALFTGPYASETALKGMNAGLAVPGHPRALRLSDVRILHFAAHGQAEPDFPETSRVVLSQPEMISAAEKADLQRAFPQFMEEDGSLLAAEILALQLRADLVVLSACETGLGRITGTEGIVGLTQSWLISGSNGVVVSLWPVDDVATHIFMVEFHMRIKAGLNPREALSDAQRALRTGTWRRGIFAPDKALAAGPPGKTYRDLDLSLPIFWSAFQYWGR